MNASFMNQIYLCRIKQTNKVPSLVTIKPLVVGFFIPLTKRLPGLTQPTNLAVGSAGVHLPWNPHRAER